ncbi:hypothetical protein O181_015498 [Austropuccinia psidii MF-1]|uniref:Uncharacterized protein n=1 Tax=Austropuccinia psidii MF-1 TaxID=1389203 RepID=A0A9Q3C3C3_9BASI|nr:hypothetical protein [Austropuccinia psidii MF-1]
MDFIHEKDAKMKKPKPGGGKGYEAGSFFITNIVIGNKEAKINLESGSFCACVGNDHLERSYNNSQEQLMPIEGIKSSSASQNMHPLDILEAEMIFPDPA